MEQTILGTEVKFAVTLEAEGFSMAEDNFTLMVMKGRNVVKEIAKEDLVVENDTYILCIDTNEIGVGNFDIAVNAQVPDGHFGDGYRTEIQRVQLLNVRKL